MRMSNKTAICTLFFLSGLTALMYEVVWVRALGLVFGNTTHATATVLAAYMAGLGLGGWIIGRLADRWQRPLRAYGFLGLGIAAYAVLTFVLLGLIQSAYVAVARVAGVESVACTAARAGLAFCMVFVPAFLMGGTLPTLVRAYVTGADSVGSGVSRLYGINTAGAVAGTLIAGFWSIPVLGMRWTVGLAAALGAGIAGTAIVLGSRTGRRLFEGTETVVDEPTGSKQCGAGWWLPVALAVSGAAAMTYEVAWTRALAAVLGSSTYAFTLMLATFLLGMALGSSAMSRLLAGRRARTADWVWLQLILAASAIVALPAFETVPLLMVRLYALTVGQWALMSLCRLGVCAALMIVPTFCLGALFPVAASLYATRLDTAGRRVGRLYLYNTVGNIAGSLAAGFLLITAIGIHGTLMVAAGLGIALGWLPVLARPRRTARSVAATAVALALCLALFLQRGGWDPHLLSMGIHIRPARYLGKRKCDVYAELFDKDLLFYREGLHCIVSVFRSGDQMMLKVNGKTDASSGLDTATQLLSGHIPHLLHPDPKRSLVIGLGSGMTLAAALAHDLERVDSVELERAVVEGAKHFEPYNRKAWLDERACMIVNDGRNHLLVCDESYDVIISEPSNPWMAGVAGLFTVEFYELVEKRLAEDGLLCQWIQAYGLAPGDFKMVIASVREIFPHVTLWATLGGDVLVIAGRTPITLDLDKAQSRFERLLLVRRDLAEFGMHSAAAILAYFELGSADVARFIEGAPLNTDDRMPLEFTAPRSLHDSTLSRLNRRAMAAFREQELPRLSSSAGPLLAQAELLVDIGESHLGRRSPSRIQSARLWFKRALEIAPSSRRAQAGLARCLAIDGKLTKALSLFTKCLNDETSLDRAAHAAAVAAWKGGHRDYALRLIRDLCEREPDNATFLLDFAKMLEAMGAAGEAEAVYRTCMALAPHNIESRLGNVRCLRRQGELDAAAKMIEELRRHYRTRYSVYRELSRVYDAMGAVAPQIEAFERLVQLNPFRPHYWATLVDLYTRADQKRGREWALRMGRRTHRHFDDVLAIGAMESESSRSPDYP